MGRLAHVKDRDPIGDWAPIMFRVLADYGIRPWEFGELTYPWLLMILGGGNSTDGPPVNKRQVARSIDLARRISGIIGGQGSGNGHSG